MNPQEKPSEIPSEINIKNEQAMEIQENNISSIVNEQQKDGFRGGMIVPQKKLDEIEEKQIWKLFKGKTVLVFRFCGSCQYKLFHSTDKWARNKDGIVALVAEGRRAACCCLAGNHTGWVKLVGGRRRTEIDRRPLEIGGLAREKRSGIVGLRQESCACKCDDTIWSGGVIAART